MRLIADNIKFIGADDDSLDLFEGQYPLPAGISYNSYLIEDEKTAIIDAVDIRRCDEWLETVSEALAGKQPDYVIVQHMEPDHSGSLKVLLENYQGLRVVCTVPAAKMLANFFEDFDFSDRITTVKDGDTLSLGATQLHFITAPMVHWPEVMLTLDETHGVLFSADAFGSFAMSGAGVESAWDSEARRYYTNIVGRFGTSVRALMSKLTEKRFSVIAPLHGPVLTENLEHYWALYDKWSGYQPESDGVLVAYASIYGGTAEAARVIASELQAQNADQVVLMDLCRHDVSFAVAEAFRFSRMVLCSVTYDAGLFPAMANFLHHLQSKNLRSRRIALVENGSWAPIAAKLMEAELAKMKDIEIIDPILSIKNRLHKSDRATITSLAATLLHH